MTLIAIIEDNPVNMRLVCSILHKHDYETVVAVDAEQGIALIEEKHPDLILMDIQLPGMDGLEATQILKSNKEFSHIPIIALTASAMIGDERKVLEAGCDAYLSKPVSYQQLLKTILEHLPC